MTLTSKCQGHQIIMSVRLYVCGIGAYNWRIEDHMQKDELPLCRFSTARLTRDSIFYVIRLKVMDGHEASQPCRLPNI